MLTFWKSCMLTAAAAVLSLGAPARAETKLNGTGATFPAPLYAQWVEAFNKANPEIKADYASQGSGAGIKAITDRTAHYGASDAPMSPDQEKAAPAKLLHIPTVAGPEVMIYKLKDVPKLTLNGEVIADIYIKNIRTWNDAKIAALNPGVKLPAAPIVVVHRSDGSGTTFIFTDFLSKVNKKWDADIGKGTTVDWPIGIAGKGNDGVAAAVGNTEGGIGYVEYAFAKKNNLVFADLKNQAGKVVAPSIDAINAAGAAAVANFPADMKVSITNAPGEDAYPICGFTYLLVYEDLSYLKDKNTATALVSYLKWCETEGQESAAGLGYARLPKEVQSKVVERLKTIKFNGESLLK